MSGKKLKNVIAARYALALFQITKEQNKQNIVEDELQALVNLKNTSSDFAKFVSDRLISKDDRVKVIKAIVDKNSISDISKNFLCLIANKNRLNLMSEIFMQFKSLTATDRDEVTALITSASGLSKAQIDGLKTMIASATGISNVKLDIKEDKGIIGGLIVRVGSIIVDSSIKSKLDRLQRKLKNVSTSSSSVNKNAGEVV